MSSYTLNPVREHGVGRKEIMAQFFFFLRQMRGSAILEKSDAKTLRENVRTMKRWGSLEGGTLANTARNHPEKLGLVDDDGQLTYAEFLDHVIRLAGALEKRGVTDGSNVAVMALNGRAAIFPLCARQMLGYHIFMINANSSGAQIERVLTFHEVDTLIVDQSFAERLTPAVLDRVQVIIGHVSDRDALPEGVEVLADIIDESTATADDLPAKPKTKSMHVVMTSGTTGMPKGVIRRQLRSPQGIGPALAAIPWRRDMTIMLTGVLFHFYGWANMLVCLLTGSTIVTQREFSNEKALRQIEELGATAWISSASRLRGMTAYLDEQGIDKVDGLEFICSSGSPLTPYEVEAVTEKFGPVLHNSYGSTETAALALSGRGELAEDSALTGTIYPGYVVKILDDEGNELPDGEIGEIYAGCYDMFAGYTDPDVPVRTHDGLLRMGDRGYRQGNKLYVKGRADDLVITQFGEKIFPSELEDLLIRDSRVEDIHVHGVSDPKFGQALRAYVIRNENDPAAASLDEDEVRRLITETLSDAHAPRDVFFVADFPRNPMGKVIRPELPGKSTV